MGVVSAGEGVRDFDVFVRRAIDYLHRDLASLGLWSSPRDFASGGAAGVREREIIPVRFSGIGADSGT